MIVAGFLVTGVSYAHGVDLGVDPGILPTSPFYFVKEWRRAVQRVFTFNAVKKADLELNILNERAAEAQKISVDDPQNIEAVKKALGNYIEAHDRLANRLRALKETSQSPNVDKLLDKLVEKTAKHESLFEDISKEFDDKDEIKKLAKSAKDDLDEAVSLASEKDDVKKFAERLKKEAEKEVDDKEDAAEKSAHQIKEAEEKINELEKKIQKADAPSAEASKHLTFAKEHLAAAKQALEEKKYGEAFGQARSAEVLARNGMKVLERETKDKDDDGDDEDFSEDLGELERKISKQTALLNEKGITQNLNPGAYKLLENAKQHLGFARDALAKKDLAGVKLHIVHIKGFLSDLARIIDSSGRAVKPVSDREVNLETSVAAVVIDENGNFSPSEVKIKKGGKITWTNKSSRAVWPASAVHPTHQELPGFDALRGISAGESYSFRFDKPGSWRYHDHLNPALTGVVRVSE